MRTYGVLRFVSDPELTTVGNTVKSNFKLVKNVARKDIDGNLIKDAHFFEFECWDSGAEFIVNNCKKGDEIFVEATAKQENWEKDGQKRNKILFRIDSFKVFN